jgi:hypothetical protein
VVAAAPIKPKTNEKETAADEIFPVEYKQLKFSTQNQRHDKNSLYQKNTYK